MPINSPEIQSNIESRCPDLPLIEAPYDFKAVLNHDSIVVDMYYACAMKDDAYIKSIQIINKE